MQVSFKNSIYNDLIRPQENNGLFSEFTAQSIAANSPMNVAQQADKFVSSKKHLSKNTKIKIGIFATIAAFAIGTAIINSITTGNLPGVKNAQKYAKKIQEKADVIKNEVTSIYNNGGQIEGKTVATIIKTDSIDIMKEVASDGTLLRESRFTDKVLSQVKIPVKNGDDIYAYARNGKLACYINSFKKFTDGSINKAKEFLFKDGKLIQYTKCHKYNADKSYEFSKRLIFKNDKLNMYIKGLKENADRSQVYKNIHIFEDGEFSIFTKDLEIDKNKNFVCKKLLFFKDDNTSSYIKGLEIKNDGGINIKKRHNFDYLKKKTLNEDQFYEYQDTLNQTLSDILFMLD